MRITNKMMNNDSRMNINKNKEYLDKLNNQFSSGKKITRPSDDPVIAIRALKLRSNVTELTQFHDKNANDANAWLTATQDAIESTKGILTGMKAQFTEGATGTNTTESRKAIIKELQALRDQIYDDGNADYAGRQLFTGFRTNTKLTVQESDLPLSYEGITETFSREDMDTISYVSGKLSMGEDVVNAATTPVVEQDVVPSTLSRLRLAYDRIADGSISDMEINYADGSAETLSITNISASTPGYPDIAYQPGDDDILFNSVTGELILGKNIATKIQNLGDEDTMTLSYDKTDWQKGDLRPEHYFDCVQNVLDENGDVIKDVAYTEHNQEIYYDVSANQQMQINTYASDVYVHAIGRDIDEMIKAIENTNAAEEKVAKLKSMLDDDSLTDAEKENIQTTLDAANKELTFVKDKMQKMFEHGQTKFGDYLGQTILAGTEVGTRIQRVDLVQERLLSLKTTATELADDNENVELPDIAIAMSEAELTYNAALMSTGKISQQTLLNYL